MNTVLVIAAHPDDEVLGCGGTMGLHAANGDDVHVAILAEGLTSRSEARNRDFYTEEFSQLQQAAKKANDLLGVKELKLYDCPDNRMDTMDRLDVIKLVERIIDEVKPNIIYTHHIGDVNIDHRRIHEAVITATRPIPGNHHVETLLFFETASSTEWMTVGSAPAFVPNWFINIEKTLDMKLKALEAYESEMREWPHARSIEALNFLAKWRGANIGKEAAEAFVLGRMIVE